ncbi:hypothetical protein ACFP3U_18085 [Kitasatospora misakiensis]|uniref:Uncharacterized protein n=1 Tax=Kitasatospora misakiensis TaxID=67330 RepID=A0ABW0X8N0_9ACTN
MPSRNSIDGSVLTRSSTTESSTGRVQEKNASAAGYSAIHPAALSHRRPPERATRTAPASVGR